MDGSPGTDELIYFDAAATTRCHDSVISAMTEFSVRQFGNPSSVHLMGKFAKQAVEQAIEEIASLLVCDADELTITSGATESNNIVILGTASGEGQNIIVCPTDHKSTLEAVQEMQRRGVNVRYMRVDGQGRIDIDHLRSIIDERTILVSLASVNSETGVIQDIESIADLLVNSPAFYHIDATQAVGKLSLDMRDSDRVDGVSLSAHKIGGPKGVGALFVRRSSAIQPRPLTFGGGQSRLRSGTQPSQLIVGFGTAVKAIQFEGLEHRLNAWQQRRSLIFEGLHEHGVQYVLNSSEKCSVPSIINLSFPGVRSETVIKGLPKVCVSSGSACNAKSLSPSYVLKAMGLSDDRANTAIRLSFQPEMSLAQVKEGAHLLGKKVGSLQSLTNQELWHVLK